MKRVIDISEEEYNEIEPFLNGETIKGGFNLFRALEIIKNGTPLPDGAEILTKEAYSDLCTRAADVPATNDGDTISRRAAIDILDDLACDYESGRGDNAHSEARGRMINLPSVEPEKCEYCISFEDAVELVYKARRMPPIEGVLTDTMSWAIAFVRTASFVKPERKVGKWIEHPCAEEENGLLISNWECNLCGMWERKTSDFCPNCGAKMEVNE